MPNYRRVFIPGGTWFFTVNLLDRRSRLLVEHVDLLREAVRHTKVRHPFGIDAMVILPDHIHAIWSLPEDDHDFALRWRLIKSRFSRQLPDRESRSSSRIKRRERGIWQRRYWEHFIRDENDFNRHIAYCYFNPIKHGLVQNPGDWPYSSFHRDMREDRSPALPDVELWDGTSFGEAM